MTYFLVGLGGILGALARYHLGRIIAERYSTSYPLGTFLINISGATALGVVYAIGLNNNFQHLLADGFLAAFTTYSTFMYEGIMLIRENKIMNAGLYVCLSLILGILGFGGGFFATRYIFCG